MNQSPIITDIMYLVKNEFGREIYFTREPARFWAYVAYHANYDYHYVYTVNDAERKARVTAYQIPTEF